MAIDKFLGKWQMKNDKSSSGAQICKEPPEGVGTAGGSLHPSTHHQ